MTRFVYATATSLDGFLADSDNSLDWLFAVDGGEEALSGLEPFVAGVGVMVEGSTTYRWVLDHEGLLEAPEKWQQFYGDKATFLFTSRDDVPLVPGADIRVVSGPVADHLDAICAAAGDRDVWIVGGGDLVGQFDDAGALDEVRLSVAAVTLGSGAPLLPRRIESDRLRLAHVGQVGQFVELRYDVLRQPTSSDPDTCGSGSETATTPAAAEEEPDERDDHNDDENGPQHGATPI